MADSACSATAYLGGVKANIGTTGVTGRVKLDDCAGMNNVSNQVTSILKWSQVKIICCTSKRMLKGFYDSLLLEVLFLLLEVLLFSLLEVLFLLLLEVLFSWTFFHRLKTKLKD